MKYALGIFAVILLPLLVIAALFFWRKSKKGAGSSQGTAPNAYGGKGSSQGSAPSETTQIIDNVSKGADAAGKVIDTLSRLIPQDDYVPDASEPADGWGWMVTPDGGPAPQFNIN